MAPMRVERVIHILDDDAAVRRSLERLLRSAGFEFVSYETPFALLDAAPLLARGCLLLDVRMPGMDGLELQVRLNELGIDVPVVVMTAQGNVQIAVKAMQAGAVDFLEKPFDDIRLFAAIERALAEDAHMDLVREAVGAALRISALSPRERQILDGLLAGHPNKVTAAQLGLSVRTVEGHRARMLERLGIKGVAEAIRLAVMANLAPVRGPEQPL
jgi:two-component system response regulator FixJ